MGTPPDVSDVQPKGRESEARGQGGYLFHIVTMSRRRLPARTSNTYT